jgi:hypothetical protein
LAGRLVPANRFSRAREHAHLGIGYGRISGSFGGERMLRKKETLLMALGVGLAVAAGASGSGSLNGPGAVRVTARQVKHIHVDGGRVGHGAGDTDFYRQSLFNKGITSEAIGHSDVMCVHTGTASLNCTGTYFLPRGKMMVSGVIGSRLIYELAVVGGTGLYSNVRGTLTATNLGGPYNSEFLLFRLEV